ncbi:MAG: dipicolinate synthase subunit DpsA [Bacillota bacterium]|jgi:dipicolinate synthase subunit A
MAEKVVALLGGDQREFQVVPALKTAGWKVQVFGLPKNELPTGVMCCDTIKEAVQNVFAVILPLPGIRNNGRLHAPFADNPIVKKTDLEVLSPQTPVITGVCSDYLRDLAADLELNLLEVAEDDKIAIPNAIPTAEAAIQITMEKTDITVDGMKTLVLGYGRVGAALADKLNAMGARVIVTNRSSGRFAAAARDGYSIYPWDSIKDVVSGLDVIFNTVPALVIDKEILMAMDKRTLVIDLASSPGGTDFRAADELDIEAVHALSLPGKVAPVTAGKILAGFYPMLLNRIINDEYNEKSGGVYHEKR